MIDVDHDKILHFTRMNVKRSFLKTKLFQYPKYRYIALIND